MMNRAIFVLVAVVLLTHCKPKQEPIAYGESQCSFCKMTVVDKIHGAEIVTDKGKVYVYDAVECMLNDKFENPDREVALYLVNHYSKPVELIDATQAVFLVSENLPSPMGGNLTSFKNNNVAENALAEYGGKLYSWQEIVEAYER